MLRGALTLIVIAVGFLAADVIERLVIVPLARLRPASRERILTRWAGLLSTATLRVLRGVAGARIELPPPVPARSGVLLLANHQSLMDIPIVFKSLEGGYGRIVTRRRYARGIPLVSHMLRLYEHPLVEPGKTSREDVEALATVGRTSERPLVVFPEGHRTRDGEIRLFKRSGVRAILAARRWSVHVLVVDGLWQCARLTDFVRNIGSVHARAEILGPFPGPEPGEDADAFLEEMREHMRRKLSEMRDRN